MLEKNIYDIPLDVLAKHLFRYFTIFEIIYMSRVNRLFAKLARHRLLWQEKFQLHFHHLSPFIKNEPNTDWFSLFINTCAEQYTHKQTRVFLISQEGDLNEYKKRINENNIEIDNFVNFIDKQKRIPIESIISAHNQLFLNTIFEDANNHYFANRGLPYAILRARNGWSLAHWATACNQPNSVISQHLVGINQEEFPVTPFHLAAEFGLEDKVNFFLNTLNYDPSHRTQNVVPVAQSFLKNCNTIIRKTALHSAANKGHDKVIAELLKHPRTNIHDALEVIVSSGPQRHIINAGVKAIHLAARNNHTKTVEILFQKGASPLDCDGEGHFALFSAVIFLNSEMFELCMRKLPEPLTEGDTTLLNQSLFLAVQQQQIDFIRALLSKRASPYWVSPNNHSSPNRTAIDLAIELRNNEILHLLIPIRNEISKNSYRPQRIANTLGLVGFILGLIVGATLAVISILFFKSPSFGSFIYLLLSGPIVGALVSFLFGKYLEHKMTHEASEFLQNVANVSTERDLEIGRGSDDSTLRSCSLFGFFNRQKVDLYKKTDDVRLGMLGNP
jgi:ankyrin repeat protein